MAADWENDAAGSEPSLAVCGALSGLFRNPHPKKIMPDQRLEKLADQADQQYLSLAGSRPQARLRHPNRTRG
ncbi:hypothetical protein FACS1894186_0610 [Alphaproteobacteria bacterium]|nr:hypothetical protein FACS1894186_0610 [Alphaproteobacteria bacterium]